MLHSGSVDCAGRVNLDISVIPCRIGPLPRGRARGDRPCHLAVSRPLPPGGMTLRRERAAQGDIFPISTDFRVVSGVAHDFTLAIAVASRLYGEQLIARGEVIAISVTEPFP